MKQKNKYFVVLCWTLFIVLLSVSAIALTAAGQMLFIPMIFGNDGIDPTATPISTPTAYTWAYVGMAFERGDQLKIYGIRPGYCYEMRYTKNVKTVNISSEKITLDECDREGWAGEWPPPEYGIPLEFPPPFMWGEVFSMKLDMGAKKVCGSFHCIEVK